MPYPFCAVTFGSILIVLPSSIKLKYRSFVCVVSSRLINSAPALLSVADTTFTSASISMSPYFKCTGTTSPTFSFLLCASDTPPLEMFTTDSTYGEDWNTTLFSVLSMSNLIYCLLSIASKFSSTTLCLMFFLASSITSGSAGSVGSVGIVGSVG